MASEGARRADWFGRIIGLAVFLAGIVLLVVVFIWTNQLEGIRPKPGDRVDASWGIGFGIRIAQLFIAGLLASWIAGRGAQMYAAANRALSGD